MSFYSLSFRQNAMYKYDFRAIITQRCYVTLLCCSSILKSGCGLERTVEENGINIDGNKAHRVHWSSLCVRASVCVCALSRLRVWARLRILRSKNRVVHTQRDVKTDLDPDIVCNLWPTNTSRKNKNRWTDKCVRELQRTSCLMSLSLKVIWV